jgi:hypothetical protein
MTTRTTPAARLLAVIGHYRAVPVDDLSHADWHSILKVFEVLVRELEPHAAQGAHVTPIWRALVSAAHRASRDQLPGSSDANGR